MDRIAIPEKAFALFDKYKYVMLVIVLGLVLMLWPGKKDEPAAVQSTAQSPQQLSVTEELSAILGQIRGVGRVRVMITEQSGARTHYQTDESGFLYLTGNGGQRLFPQLWFRIFSDDAQLLQSGVQMLKIYKVLL